MIRRFIIPVILFATLTASLVVLTAATPSGSRQHTLIVLRKIGHQLLLKSGDSVSRVLPVAFTDDQVYTIAFERPFSFSADTLVKIVRETLREGGIKNSFSASMVACSSHEMIYGFEIRYNENHTIPCLGRAQPRGCYQLQITLDEDSSWPLYAYYIFATAGLSVFAFVGGSYLTSKKNTNPAVSSSIPAEPFLHLGKYKLYPVSRMLKHEDESIELSDKESTLLEILVRAQNELVTRDRLLKEVWEDHGVFTGRSLDMFISRIRKKLKDDPSVQVMSVHGRGYKLVVNPGV